MITPQDIENKIFTYALKGYKREEVDKFLDEITLELTALLEENQRLQRNIASLQQEIQEHKQNESSVMETIEQAKSLMSDISESAEKRAEVIIKNAHADATRIVQEARESVSTLTSQSDTMKANLDTFKAHYKSFLKKEMSRIDGIQNDLFADLASDFYPVDKLPETKVAESEAQQPEMEDPAVAAGFFSEPVSQEPAAENRTPMDDLFANDPPVQTGESASEEPAEGVTDQTLTELVLEKNENGPAFDENAKTIVLSGAEDFLHSNQE